ncbi:MAG: FAD-binding oxidoreductase [Pseudomonadota bacterium]
MKCMPYWRDTAPVFADGAALPDGAHFDVAVVGAGFTGLSAARSLALSGARVVVLEAERVGHGGSGRNGGHLNNGLSHSYLDAVERFGPHKAKALYETFDHSIKTIERIVEEEGIDCSFRRSGKLKLASKPAHFKALQRNFDALHKAVDTDTAILGPNDLEAEVRGGPFHGGLLYKKSAMMHMGRFVTGLAEAVHRKGGVIVENAAVTGRRRDAAGHILTTPAGTVAAREVILATGAYTRGPFGYFRRRVIPVGSFVIATRPLSDEEIAATLPGRRTYVTSMNVGNYFRLSPDNRLLFGGRARFTADANIEADRVSADILRKSLGTLFPSLADVTVDYCWGGLVGMTKDRLPRAGFADGVHFAMGYSGHGAQLSVHMGEVLADIVNGRADCNPLDGLAWPAVPGHFGRPWFLPAVGAYYKMKDRLG